MGYYKIKNVTDLLAKRHSKTNTVQIIEIVDSFKTQKINLSPNDEFLLETNFLPINLHKLRTEGVISVVELDKNTYHQMINEQSKKKLESQQTESKEIEESQDEKSKKTFSKPTKRDR